MQPEIGVVEHDYVMPLSPLRARRMELARELFDHLSFADLTSWAPSGLPHFQTRMRRGSTVSVIVTETDAYVVRAA